MGIRMLLCLEFGRFRFVLNVKNMFCLASQYAPTGFDSIASQYTPKGFDSIAQGQRAERAPPWDTKANVANPERVVQNELRGLLRKYGIDFDERYVWD